MATAASIGAAPVPGAGIIMLMVMLSNLGLPQEGLALILGVDRLLDMSRTVVNVTSDAVACAIVHRLSTPACKRSERLFLQCHGRLSPCNPPAAVA
jgi:Na+/H+-dicarboxylate symporter